MSNEKDTHSTGTEADGEHQASRGAEAAERARAEAEARRAANDAEKIHGSDLPPEEGGRKGPEPVRYGDWENKGIATDF
ncbi:DUF1674 domain-containing protein [Acuticoccus sp. MNP-M23]|uniref:DUF1674 domain-containing protein n=1 Tax=Acuticoccus sp. MNP-M23 TaxID=3072793 RepID=UPI002814B2A7|nr:DUF1674 domain-containing protein [Acuticoccus sp. MNP-M23]WMS41568.1 DUF1674 domain-containing protein [Acuticoccus sp. MNP-M23]